MSTQTGQKRRKNKSSLSGLMTGLRYSYLGVGVFVAYKLMKQETFNDNEMKFFFATNAFNEYLMFSVMEQIVSEDPNQEMKNVASLRKSVMFATLIYGSTLLIPYTKYDSYLKYVVALIAAGKALVGVAWIGKGCGFKTTEDTMLFSGFVYGIAFGTITRQLFKQT